MEIASFEMYMKNYIKVIEEEEKFIEIVREYSDGERTILMKSENKEIALALFCGICSHYTVPNSQKGNPKSIANAMDRAYWIYTEEGRKRNKGG